MKRASYISNSFSVAMIISGSLLLGGCGDKVLDGSSESALMASYSEMRELISPDKVAIFDLAFQMGRERSGVMRKKNPGMSQEEIRRAVFDGRDPYTLVNDARTYVQERIGGYSYVMQQSSQCLRSYEQGLKMTNVRMRNSLQSPDTRVEVMFDLKNGSNYPILALQVDINIQVFGSPDYEQAYIGDRIARCNTKSIVQPGTTGSFSCLLNYAMNNITFDGPVEDLQVFKAKIVNNDSNLLDGKEEENSLASCRHDSEQYKQEVDSYNSIAVQLSRF